MGLGLVFYGYLERTLLHLYKYIDDSVQNCSNSIVLAMELLQSYTKPSI